MHQHPRSEQGNMHTCCCRCHERRRRCVRSVASSCRCSQIERIGR
ncbi:hypothetical protein LINPERPRIM_LOCUS13959 [Linum perenne]